MGYVCASAVVTGSVWAGSVCRASAHAAARGAPVVPVGARPTCAATEAVAAEDVEDDVEDGDNDL